MTEHMELTGDVSQQDIQVNKPKPSEIPQGTSFQESLRFAKRTPPKNQSEKNPDGSPLWRTYYKDMDTETIKNNAASFFSKDARVDELIKKVDRTPEEERLLVEFFDPRSSADEVAGAAVALRVNPDEAQHWLGIQVAEAPKTNEVVTKISEETSKRAADVLSGHDDFESYSPEDFIYVAKVGGWSQKTLEDWANSVRGIEADDDTEESKKKRNEKIDKILAKKGELDGEVMEKLKLEEEKKKEEEMRAKGEEPVSAPLAEKFATTEKNGQGLVQTLKEEIGTPKDVKNLPKDKQNALITKIKATMDDLMNPEFSRRLAWKIPVSIIMVILVAYLYALYAATGWAKKK